MQKKLIARAVVGAAVGMAIALMIGDRSAFVEPVNHYDGVFRASDDPELSVELIPSAHEFINSDGFFGPEFDLVAPEGTWRIVALGDSVSMYYSVEGMNHLSILERELPAVVGGPVEVLNLGVASWETPQQVRSLTVTGLKYAPDFVVVSHCINDGIAFLPLGALLGLEEQMGPSPSDDSIATHRAIRDAVAADDGLDWDGLFHTVIEPMIWWQDSVAAFRHLAEIAEENDFGVLVVLFPPFLELDDYYLAPVHRALEALGAELGFAVIDLAPAYAAEGDAAEFQSAPTDAVHPNPRGYAIAAAEMKRWFVENHPWQTRNP